MSDDQRRKQLLENRTKWRKALLKGKKSIGGKVSKLTSNEKVVGLALAEHVHTNTANREFGRVWISTVTLAQDYLDMKRATVTTAVAVLRESGWLKVVGRGRGGNYEYVLNIPDQDLLVPKQVQVNRQSRNDRTETVTENDFTCTQIGTGAVPKSVHLDVPILVHNKNKDKKNDQNKPLNGQNTFDHLQDFHSFLESMTEKQEQEIVNYWAKIATEKNKPYEWVNMRNIVFEELAQAGNRNNWQPFILKTLAAIGNSGDEHNGDTIIQQIIERVEGLPAINAYFQQFTTSFTEEQVTTQETRKVWETLRMSHAAFDIVETAEQQRVKYPRELIPIMETENDIPF